ncbi:hypothetical protein B0H17DRAFT_1284539 [Mycena rosella]|uniref:Uncharacterized protein n=1 Tax=Mycena rosella TaxID=1033263 RepID=A0AAD7GF47_MYCRO|nr:hypothetical protein B0H17DRAFT_1284539 [Mycena rosella]
MRTECAGEQIRVLRGNDPKSSSLDGVIGHFCGQGTHGNRVFHKLRPMGPLVASPLHLFPVNFYLNSAATRFALVFSLRIISVFCLQLADNILLTAGLVPQYYENSTVYSGVKPAPNPALDNVLQHITIHCPVYKEKVRETISRHLAALEAAGVMEDVGECLEAKAMHFAVEEMYEGCGRWHRPWACNGIHPVMGDVLRGRVHRGSARSSSRSGIAGSSRGFVYSIAPVLYKIMSYMLSYYEITAATVRFITNYLLFVPLLRDLHGRLPWARSPIRGSRSLTCIKSGCWMILGPWIPQWRVQPSLLRDNPPYSATWLDGAHSAVNLPALSQHTYPQRKPAPFPSARRRSKFVFRCSRDAQFALDLELGEEGEAGFARRETTRGWGTVDAPYETERTAEGLHFVTPRSRVGTGRARSDELILGLLMGAGL